MGIPSLFSESHEETKIFLHLHNKSDEKHHNQPDKEDKVLLEDAWTSNLSITLLSDALVFPQTGESLPNHFYIIVRMYT